MLEFARMLIEEPAIEYTLLTGFTEEGKAKVEELRTTLNRYTPELVAEECNYLGSIWPNPAKESGKVDGFDEYYTSEKTTVNVADLLDDVLFILVPEENVDGRMVYTRCSAGGCNLNRDNCLQVMPETQNMQHLIEENAVSQFSGEEGGDVIISNASESSTAAVNTLLASGKQVDMITEGAKVLVKRDGNDVNITLFDNSMTDRGHQRDEYAFISNAILSSFLTETAYVTTAE